MAKFIHVSPEDAHWLKKAIDFAKRNEAGLVSGTYTVILNYLIQNKIPHSTANREEDIPHGHHYSRHD